VDAWCVADADAKAAGESGCGCGESASARPILVALRRDKPHAP
jgi:hypothetical protein